MLTPVLMPRLGETMKEGKLVRWLKHIGDKIKKDEVIVEVSTDKANFEVESPCAGYLLKILFNDNTVVKVNEPIGYIGDKSDKK